MSKRDELAEKVLFELLDGMKVKPADADVYAEAAYAFADEFIKQGKAKASMHGADAEAIYDAYPWKGNKPRAIKAIEKVLARGCDTQWLLDLTRGYAGRCELSKKPKEIIAATWFNQRKFEE